MSEGPNKRWQWNVFTSFNIVAGLGFALMVLSGLRALGSTIPPTMIMGVSISSALLVFVEFLITTSDKVPMRTIVILSFAAVIVIICFPYIPFISYVSAETLSKYSDVVTLFAFGITVLAVGFKGLNEYKMTRDGQPNQSVEERPEGIES